MKKRDDFEMFADSQCAIRDYMDSKVGNDFLHDARVLVSSGGETKYNSILKVHLGIETNNSVVHIIGDAKFELDYYSKYTNKYQKFAFIDGALLIKGEDRWGNPIEIDITSI